MDFQSPDYLYLFIPFAIFTLWYWIKRLNVREHSLPLSSADIVSKKRNFKALLYPYIPVLRFLSAALIIFASARPGNDISYSEVSSYGVDIMIVTDVSLSMLGTDFQPGNRLEVSKTLLKSFVADRTTDRVGMIVFAGEAYVQSPMTTDYNIFNELIDEVDFDSVSEEGTAIGNAIALAVARMSDSDTASKIMVLITDGSNNSGIIEPDTAAQIAAEKGIKIYTVGIGTKGDYTIIIPRGPKAGRYRASGDYDEDGLKKISEITGGKFFRATTETEFMEYIEEINRLEKSKFTVKQYHEFDGKWMKYLLLAAFIFIFEQLIRIVVFRKVP
ncbi:MAG: VWA domain-containing protein [Spirochaetes bacterium]|nr:VWA domain-containing protein [Spirochaetota bacterium]MBN2769515.1 VWA domain-containing protein [Spirochaetota bacterium]